MSIVSKPTLTPSIQDMVVSLPEGVTLRISIDLADELDKEISASGGLVRPPFRSELNPTAKFLNTSSVPETVIARRSSFCIMKERTSWVHVNDPIRVRVGTVEMTVMNRSPAAAVAAKSPV